MSPKSELISVRVEEELAEEITEVVEKRRQNTPENRDKPGEPAVLRELLRTGVEDYKQGESDLSRLRRKRDELKSQNENLRDQLETPIRERLSYSLLAVIGGSAVVVLSTMLLSLLLVLEELTGPLGTQADPFVLISLAGIVLGLVVVAVSGTIVVARHLSRSLAGGA